MPDVALSIGGQRYGGFTSCSIHAAIEELSPSFSAGYVQNVEGSDLVRIEEGAAVEIELDGKLLLSGYVDDSAESYDSNTHQLTITGRAITCDLVDCSAIYKGGSIVGKNVLQIAQLLCEPFGLTVSLDPVLRLDPDVSTVVTGMKLDEGETPYSALLRITKKRGLLMATDVTGGLVLTRATKSPSLSLIRQGDNVKSGGFVGTMRERYSHYTFKSQMPSSDDWNGAASSQIKNVALDTGVKRYRPLVVVAEHGDTLEHMRLRAEWEANNRAGRAQTLQYTVTGWEGLDGVWWPNTLPRVIDPKLGIDDSYLVTTVDLVMPAKGDKTAQMTLMDRSAYDVFGLPKVKRSKKKTVGVINPKGL